MHINRLWMTGCMALVLLLAGRLPARAEQEDDADARSGQSRIALSSRYDLDETTRRIEQLARRQGWSIVARTRPGAGGPSADPAVGAPERVLVLGDAAGRTPAVQADGEPLPVLPWQVCLSRQPDGRTEVSLIDPAAVPWPDDGAQAGPAGWLDHVRRWPHVLREALT